MGFLEGYVESSLSQVDILLWSTGLSCASESKTLDRSVVDRRIRLDFNTAIDLDTDDRVLYSIDSR